MKNILLAFFILGFSGVGRSQNWTWMKGSNTVNATGVYGTKGVAAAANTPGARNGAVTWFDLKGNLWLFGGQDNSNKLYNDLWKFDVSTNNWTWINGSSSTNSLATYGSLGVPSASNTPGSRDNSTGWTDDSGNLWLFGGQGYTSISTSFGRLNDLWKYNVNTNEWTWMKGSSAVDITGVYGTMGVSSSTNNPGARNIAASWYNNRKLYLFGGDVYGLGIMADLWSYDLSTNQWTWINGSNTTFTNPVYGTQGVPASSNTPGSRSGICTWTNSNGELFLFGGTAGSNKFFGDVWKYSISSKQWTWIKGPTTTNVAGVYGIQGQASATNNPGSRYKSVNSGVINNCIYMFGGYGYGSSATWPYYINDFWKFDLNSSEWTHISGSKITGQAGIYGTQGVQSSTNRPGSREYHSGISDKYGNLWLFGGWGLASTTTFGWLNDLWKYTYSCINDLSITPQNNKIKIGDTATFTAKVSDPNPTYTWQSDFGQGYVTLKNYGKYSGVNSANLKINKVELSEHKQPVRAITVSGSCIDTSNIGTIYITDTCVVTRYDTNIVKVYDTTFITIYDTSYISVTDTLVIKTKISGTTPPGLNSIKLFPNPASTHININYGNYALMSGYALKITNATGQSVYQTNITKQSDYIDLSTWGGNGLYYIYIIDPKSNVIETRKIVLK